MKKFIGCFLTISLIFVFPGCRKKTDPNNVVTTDKTTNSAEATSAKPQVIPETSAKENAIKAAILLYKQQKATGADFSSGPCLSNELIPDWVADIAHNPRLPIDNLVANQCSSFLRSEAHHFVELDPDGNIIRTM